MDFYVREKQGKLVAQYRPYFIYFANLFFDGKNSNLLLILPALASLMGVLIFYRLTRLFVPEKESFYLALFLGLASPFVTYSFRFLDVNIAVCMLAAEHLSVLQIQPLDCSGECVFDWDGRVHCF